MTMCKAVAEIRAEAREKAHAEKREKFKKRICDFVAKGQLAPEHAAEALEITVDELQTYIESAGQKMENQNE